MTANDGVNSDGINRFVAKAVSGAGGADVGVAGAFAVNVSADPLNLLNVRGGGQHNARIADGAHITVHGTDLSITSTYVGEYQATATSIPDSGPTLGIGPSVAANGINHNTLAEIGTAQITGANNIIVTANGKYTTDTTSHAGANNSGALAAAIAHYWLGQQYDCPAHARHDDEPHSGQSDRHGQSHRDYTHYG